MIFVDIAAIYLYLLKTISVILLFALLFFALDDLFIDLVYWVRRIWRKVTVYRKQPAFDEKKLFLSKEQPIAIMIPAWQEVGVVGKMAEFAASELDYENYQIFVGTYPNDEETQADVDAVCARFPHIHKVVCARPGPTSKADCLNNVIASILEFELKANIRFAGFVMHDAEDVISAMELRLFNYLLPRKDLIQLPVYPFATGLFSFTSGHYLDEFSEMHGKDVVVREALVGQVPSAGVGTCFSRRAILKLSAEGDGLPFDVQSLTEDYDIGFRLKQWGMSEIFVRFSVQDDGLASFAEKAASRNRLEGNVVCVREYFPETLSKAIRQKSRWIIGIVFQGMKTHKWSDNWKLNYFLWRDRKGVISYFVSFLATLVFFQLIALTCYQFLAQEPYRFIDLYSGDPLIVALLSANLVLFLNRTIQRAIFVRRYYGIGQALMSVPRQFWGNIINFCANIRAIRQVIAQGDPRRVAWDKTQHIYPTVSDRQLGLTVGGMLLKAGLLTEQQLELALQERRRGEKIGQVMVRLGFLTPDQLGEILAEQAGVSYQRLDPFTLNAKPITQFPEKLALKYSVIPLQDDGKTLLLARESSLSPVAIGAMERQLQRHISYVICQGGAVTLALRYWYKYQKDANPEPELNQYLAQGKLTTEQANLLRDQYFSTRIQFGEALLQASMLEASVVNQVLINFDYSGEQRLGEYLLSENLISDAVLQQTLSLQQAYQPSLTELFAQLFESSDSRAATCV